MILKIFEGSTEVIRLFRLLRTNFPRINSQNSSGKVYDFQMKDKDDFGDTFVLQLGFYYWFLDCITIVNNSEG